MDKETIMDEPRRIGRKVWCHMTSNDINTLHEIAKHIGLKREWFQDKPGHPHYDISTNSKRTLAAQLGVKLVTRRQYLLKVIEWHRKPDEFPNQLAIRPIKLYEDKNKDG